jgi:valyl-tRNA synthetase
MHDWCISRQLWWGHRIPVWYGPDGQMCCVGPDEDPPGAGWQQDPDVLDTWFSSALWPFSTLGWPDDSPDLRRFYPTDVLLTGYDIIFFWVARMMMFGLYAMSSDEGGSPRKPSEVVPFRHIVLTGLIRDQRGRKMSKSRGNTVDPLDWMDAYGSDALRFTLARGANPGTDVPIGEEWVQGSRNFCNKLWNATRFALLNGATTAVPLPGREELTTADRWILSRLHETIAEINTFYEDFEFAKISAALYHLTWDEFCDWYVELAKIPLAAGGPRAETTRAVLGHVLETMLRLLHPIIPFVTEELWTALTGGESVVIAQWPGADADYVDDDAAAEISAVQHLVTEVRRFRSEQGIKPTERVAARLRGIESTPLVVHEPQIRALARLAPPGEAFSPTAVLPAGLVSVELDLSGAIDHAAERRRLERDLATAEKERAATAAKLANPDFTARAPQPVVHKIRARHDQAAAEVERITGQLAELSEGRP